MKLKEFQKHFEISNKEQVIGLLWQKHNDCKFAENEINRLEQQNDKLKNQIADLSKKVEFLENQLAEAGKKMPDKIDFAIENLIKIQNVIFAFDICSQCKKIIKDIFKYRIDILKEEGKHDQ